MRVHASSLDSLILKRLAGWGGSAPTYVVKNIVNSPRPKHTTGYNTGQIRRRLFALEKQGKVRRVKSRYLVMIVWALVEQAPS